MEQKNKWIIKIVSVIVAFGLWLYISNVENNKIKYLLKDVPVTLTNTDYLTQAKLTVLPKQNPTVNLNLQGIPTDIYSAKRGQFRVEADMSEYAFHKGENKIPVKIVDQPPNVYILNSETLYVTINLDELVEKTFSVNLDLDVKVKDGYYASDHIVKPTDVIVRGAAKYVNQVTAVSAKGEVKSADKNLNLTLPTVAVDSKGGTISDVDIDPKFVEVTVPVRKTKTVSINVKTKGSLGSGMILKSLVPTPDKIDIAGGDLINSITSLDTEPIDLSTLSPNKTIQAKIIVPSGVVLLNSDGTVKLKPSIDRIIQKTLSLDIQGKNLGDQLNAAMDQSKVTLVVSGSENLINGLKDGDITCTVDLTGLTEGEHTVNTNISIPDGITRVSASPQSVKVTITKKTASQ